MLAKEIATIDVLSGGRVELGIGAGWMTTDYEQSGIPYDRPGVRIDRMEEGIAVIKGLFADGPVQLRGRALHDHRARRPAQAGAAAAPADPHRRRRPAGARASRRARPTSSASTRTSTAGEVGPDAAAGRAPPAVTDQKIEWVREAAGDRFDDLELNVLVFACIVTDDRRATAEMMAGVFGITPDEMLEVPHALDRHGRRDGGDIEARRDRWGFSLLRACSRTPWRRSPPWSPAWPAPMTVAGLRRRGPDHRRPRAGGPRGRAGHR